MMYARRNSMHGPGNATLSGEEQQAEYSAYPTALQCNVPAVRQSCNRMGCTIPISSYWQLVSTVKLKAPSVVPG